MYVNKEPFCYNQSPAVYDIIASKRLLIFNALSLRVFYSDRKFLYHKTLSE